MTIGEKIKRARLEAGLTQAQLAEQAGVDPFTIYRYEADLFLPRVDTLAKIGEALGVVFAVGREAAK